MSPPGKDSETEWDHNTKEGREPNKEAPRTVGKKKPSPGSADSRQIYSHGVSRVP